MFIGPVFRQYSSAPAERNVVASVGRVIIALRWSATPFLGHAVYKHPAPPERAFVKQTV
jgi:hypothetical protein